MAEEFSIEVELELAGVKGVISEVNEDPSKAWEVLESWDD